MGSSVFIEACKIVGCGMWELVPCPGIEPSPLHWEHGILATGPPGKSSNRNVLLVVDSTVDLSFLICKMVMKIVIIINLLRNIFGCIWS